MINLPSLPSDTFYKFMTFSGILLIILPFYLDSSTTEKIKVASDNWDAKSKLIVYRQNEFVYKKSELGYYISASLIDSFNRRVFFIDSIIKTDTSTNVVFKDLISTRLNYVDTNKEMIKRRVNIIIDQLDSAAPQLVSDQLFFQTDTGSLAEIYKSKKSQSWIILIFGMIVLSFGIIKWYNKHQIIQDLILKKQLTST